MCRVMVWKFLQHAIRPNTPSRRPSGFTLIELLAGLAALGVMVMVAAPSMQDFLSCQRLNSTARSISAELQLSRMQSVTEKVSHQVSFASGPSMYMLSRWDTGAGAYVLVRAPQQFDTGVYLVGANSAIAFETYGASPGGITVEINSPECGRTKEVKVNGIGRVKIL